MLDIEVNSIQFRLKSQQLENCDNSLKLKIRKEGKKREEQQQQQQKQKMVSMTIYKICIVILAVCVFDSFIFVRCYPSTETLEEQLFQQQQQKQQQEQAEEISESFLHDVKELIEEKIAHSLETVENDEVPITESSDDSIDDSVGDEHVNEQSTHAESDLDDRTRPAPISPRPKQVNDWPKLDLRLGQVVAISIGVDGHPVIFHRADRVWTAE